jgi:predicted anti-sigma-YlaC factor YlaD
MPEPDLADHLATCAACRHWATAAEQLTRRLRLAPAQVIPDLSATVASALARAGQRRRWSRRLTMLRITLALVAAAQVALTLTSGIVGGLFDTPLHVDREAGAWNLALAGGLFAVAWQVRRAAGVLPLLVTAVVAIFGFEVLDLVRSHTGPTALLPHLPLVAAVTLVAMLARMSSPPGGEDIESASTHDPVTAPDPSASSGPRESPGWAGGPAASTRKRYVA